MTSLWRHLSFPKQLSISQILKVKVSTQGQSHLHSKYKMNLMLLYVGIKYEVWRFNRNWNIDNWTTYMTSQWRRRQFDFYEIHISKRHTKFHFDRQKRGEIHSREINRELWWKREIASLWPWPSTKGHQFQKGSSQCRKQQFSKNRVQINVSVRVKFGSLTDRHTYTDRYTHTHLQTNCSENITPSVCISCFLFICLIMYGCL